MVPRTTVASSQRPVHHAAHAGHMSAPASAQLHSVPKTPVVGAECAEYPPIAAIAADLDLPPPCCLHLSWRLSS